MAALCFRRQDGAIRWMVELPGAYDPNLSVSEDGALYHLLLLQGR